jgi:hypothetical protein
MFPKSALAKAAALAVFGGVTLGGFAVAGALPGISRGTPPVSTPSPNSHAGDHPSLGAENGAAASSAKSANGNVPTSTPPVSVPSPAAPDANPSSTDAGSRADGLATAQANVTNPTASAVLGQIASGTPGPGFGQQVAAAAGAPAGPPVSTPPVSTPPQAATGLAHKP